MRVPDGQPSLEIRCPLKKSSSSASDSSASTPADHLGPVVEPAVPDDVPERADGAGLGVVGTEHDAVHAGQHERAGTHRAGLERDHQRAALQPPLAAGPGGLAERDAPRRAPWGRRRPRARCAPGRSPRRRRRGRRLRWVRRRWPARRAPRPGPPASGRPTRRGGSRRGDPGGLVVERPEAEPARRRRRASRRGRAPPRRAGRPCPSRPCRGRRRSRGRRPGPGRPRRAAAAARGPRRPAGRSASRSRR